jgi:glycosidase
MSKTKNEKLTIYQVFPRLFGNQRTNPITNGSLIQNGCGKMADFTPKALKEIKNLGISHIWYTGIIEHATQTNYTEFGIPQDHSLVVKGKAGSPYAIKDYYDIDPDLAGQVDNRMQEFEALVKRTHKEKMGVIIDFVPNHVARQYCSDAKPPYVQNLGDGDCTSNAFSPTNNFYYIPQQAFTLFGDAQQEDYPYSEFPAKATGNDQFTANPTVNDWYETIKLNYGVDYINGNQEHFDPMPDTWIKMRDILLFWASKGIDGFRCDMAEMVPVAFWHWVIKEIKDKYPTVIFIAEVYNPSLYRNYIHTGGFDYLYDKVGLYDTLKAVTCGQGSACNITHCWQSVSDIQDHMLNFLENHDEQRIASDFFAGNAAKGIPAMTVLSTLGTNPVMIYSGQELGEAAMDQEGFSGVDGRTTIFDYWSVDKLRRWNNQGAFGTEQLTAEEVELQQFYKQLLNICRTEKCIKDGTLFDLIYANESNPKFDTSKQFAFLRKAGKEVLLVVANFNSEAVKVEVNIPSEAFELLSIPTNNTATVENLITNKKSITTLTPLSPYQVSVEAYNVKMLKFTFGKK